MYSFSPKPPSRPGWHVTLSGIPSAIQYNLLFFECGKNLCRLPRWLSGNPPANAGDVGSIPGLGRSPGEGNRDPLQCSCLENSVDRGAWRATVHGGHKIFRHNLETKLHQEPMEQSQVSLWQKRFSWVGLT